MELSMLEQMMKHKREGGGRPARPASPPRPAEKPIKLTKEMVAVGQAFYYVSLCIALVRCLLVSNKTLGVYAI